MEKADFCNYLDPTLILILDPELIYFETLSSTFRGKLELG